MNILIFYPAVLAVILDLDPAFGIGTALANQCGEGNLVVGGASFDGTEQSGSTGLNHNPLGMSSQLLPLPPAAGGNQDECGRE